MLNIIWGYLGENILNRKITDFQERLINIDIIDASTNSTLIKFDEPINVLTSNHFTRTQSDMDLLYPEVEFNTDFFKLINSNQVRNIFFFLHDHSEFFVLDEPKSLTKFKAIVTPWPVIHNNARNINLFCCDMAFKNLHEFKKINTIRKSVWFVSNIKHNIEKYGHEVFAQKILEMTEDSNISVKLPEYGKYTIELEQYLLKYGAKIISSSTSTEQTILESEIIIASSYSGIASLASYYKKPVITIANNHPIDDIDPSKFAKEYSHWYTNHVLVSSKSELILELNKARPNLPKKHICGIFSDDFFDEFQKYLF